MDSYGYCYQNPINFVDPIGMKGEHIDPSELMKSKAHADAFVEFAKSKEGKDFLIITLQKGKNLSIIERCIIKQVKLVNMIKQVLILILK